ncbi:MAG: hypothetical protein JW808_03630 [Victivallales bacterium]|nr:hypothetical protein [Victivallales bacterium]
MFKDGSSSMFSQWTRNLFVATSVACTLAWRLDAQVLFDDSFEQANQSWSGLEVSDGQGMVVNKSIGKHNGGIAVLQEVLPSFPDGSTAIRLELVFKGMSAQPEGGATGSARVFLAPEPLPGFQEPYVMPHALWFSLDFQDGLPVSFTLYRKADQEQFGSTLYKAELSSGDMPLTITLDVSATSYRLNFDRDITTSQGARSGLHGLDNKVWTRGARFGLRGVNHIEGQAVRPILGSARFAMVPFKDASPLPSAGDHVEPVEPFRMIFDPTLTRAVEGYEQVPNVFGITVNGSTGFDAVGLVRELNPNSARAFLWPIMHGHGPDGFERMPVTPGRAAQFGGIPLNRQELQDKIDIFSCFQVSSATRC